MVVSNYPYRFRETTWKRSIVLWWKLPLLWKLFAWSREPTMYVNSPDDPFEIEHEFGHVVWLWEMGPWRFYTRYLFSKSFRRDAECYSNARRIRMMIQGGGYELEGLLTYWGSVTSQAYNLRVTAGECRERIRHFYEELEADAG